MILSAEVKKDVEAVMGSINERLDAKETYIINLISGLYDNPIDVEKVTPEQLALLEKLYDELPEA